MQTTETQVMLFKKSLARSLWEVSSVALAVYLGRARDCGEILSKECAGRRRQTGDAHPTHWQKHYWFGPEKYWREILNPAMAKWAMSLSLEFKKVRVVIILKCCSYSTLCPYKTTSPGRHQALASMFFGNEKYNLAYHHQQLPASALHLIY